MVMLKLCGLPKFGSELDNEYIWWTTFDKPFFNDEANMNHLLWSVYDTFMYNGPF